MQDPAPVLCQPSDSVHPVKITFDEDLRSWARESWEETLSWIQYWWEAGYTAHNPPLFCGGDLRKDSLMVLFILHHINQVLLESKPIQLEGCPGQYQVGPCLDDVTRDRSSRRPLLVGEGVPDGRSQYTLSQVPS